MTVSIPVPVRGTGHHSNRTHVLPVGLRCNRYGWLVLSVELFTCTSSLAYAVLLCRSTTSRFTEGLPPARQNKLGEYEPVTDTNIKYACPLRCARSCSCVCECGGVYSRSTCSAIVADCASGWQHIPFLVMWCHRGAAVPVSVVTAEPSQHVACTTYGGAMNHTNCAEFAAGSTCAS
jgi:hypothetical protein